MMRGSLELLPFADDDESDECSDEGLESSEGTTSLKSETMQRVFFLPRALHLKGKIVKSAMTEKRERWKGKEWYGRTKSRWQQPAGGVGGQSSHNTWDISQP